MTTDKLPKWPSIEELQKRLGTEDASFSAWRNSVPDKHWAAKDLSALRIGYELGKAAAPQREVVVDDALVEIGARAICAANGWDADERVRYSGGKLVRNKDGSFVPQWKMHETDARAAITAALTRQKGDNDA